jgi:hypothetical protein
MLSLALSLAYESSTCSSCWRSYLFFYYRGLMLRLLARPCAQGTDIYGIAKGAVKRSDAIVSEGDAAATKYTLAEIKKHASRDDCWIAIDGRSLPWHLRRRPPPPLSPPRESARPSLQPLPCGALRLTARVGRPRRVYEVTHFMDDHPGGAASRRRGSHPPPPPPPRG